MEEARFGWDAYVVPRRVDLHRRDIQECRKAGILQGASLDAPRVSSIMVRLGLFRA